MANVDWGQEVRPSVHDLIQAVNELESYTDVEHEVTGTFLERNVLEGVSGDAEIAEIRGNTVVWNQLFMVRATSATINGVTFTNNGDGSITVDGTATGGNASFNFLNEGGLSRIITTYNHKYLMKGCPAGGSSSTYMLRENWWSWGAEYGNGTIYTINQENKLQFQPQIRIIEGTTVDNLVFIPQFIDLTAMYGAGNEPTTVAEFEALWGSDYKPYSAPRLLDANIAGINGLAFPMQTLRGIGTAQDVMTSEGIERVIGEVDLGDFTWTKSGSQFYTALSQAPTSSNVRATCAKYERKLTTGWQDLTEGTFTIRSGTLRIYDSSYEDAAAFKAGNTGVKLQLVLATPATEQFATPIDLTYTVQEDGTEAWAVPEGDAPTSAPPTATIRYKMQYEYELITEKSFDNFCDALGTALNLDIAKSWNTETKEWDFTITQAASSLHAIGNSEDVAVISEPIELSKNDLKPIDNVEPVKEVNENE